MTEWFSSLLESSASDPIIDKPFATCGIAKTPYMLSTDRTGKFVAVHASM